MNSGYMGAMNQMMVQQQMFNVVIEQLPSEIKTHPLFSAISTLIIMTLVQNMIGMSGTLGKKIITNIIYYGKSLIYNIKHRINRVSYLQKTHFTKTVIIKFISDKKELNSLYEPVAWYLATTKKINYYEKESLDYFSETAIEYDVAHKIADGELKYDIQKFIPEHISDKICFNGVNIYYSYKTNKITIFGDQERQKENFEIRLSASIPLKQHDEKNVIDEFVDLCVKEYSKMKSGSKNLQKIYTLKNECSGWSVSLKKNTRTFDSVILKNNEQLKIKKILETFYASEKRYNEKNIPYKKGFLFYGHPGTGKTSMINAIANEFNLDIYFVDLRKIGKGNEDRFLDLLKKINMQKSHIVFEDIDCMCDSVLERDKKHKLGKESLISQLEIDLMKNKEMSMKYSKLIHEMINKNDESHGLNFILNIFDGVHSFHGMTYTLTTNFPEKLDKALIRPGRIDHHINFKYCDTEHIKKLFEWFYEKEPEEEHLRSITKQYSPAAIQNAFRYFMDEPDKALLNIDIVNIKPKLDELEDDSL